MGEDPSAKRRSPLSTARAMLSKERLTDRHYAQLVRVGSYVPQWSAPSGPACGSLVPRVVPLHRLLTRNVRLGEAVRILPLPG